MEECLAPLADGIAREFRLGPRTDPTLGRRLVEAVSRELKLYRELIATVKGAESTCDELTPGLGRASGLGDLAERIRRAARERREILAALVPAGREASLSAALAALPRAEAAQLVSLRRELGAVMAALGAEGARLSRVA